MSYLDSCKKNFWQKVFEKEADYLLEKLNPNEKVLSIGCGPAFVERNLVENGFSVTGLETSENRFDGAGDKIKKVIGFAEEMPFEENSFDAVVFIASLQFIDNYEKALLESKRVLKKKGKIVLMLLNPESDFIGKKMHDKNSYMNKAKHNLEEIEKTAGKHFKTQAEYFLGIEEERVFNSSDPKKAALYIIDGK